MALTILCGIFPIPLERWSENTNHMRLGTPTNGTPQCLGVLALEVGHSQVKSQCLYMSICGLQNLNPNGRNGMHGIKRLKN